MSILIQMSQYDKILINITLGFLSDCFSVCLPLRSLW